MPHRNHPQAPYWSIDGLALGTRLVLPLTPGMIAFGIVVGSAGAAKGLLLVENLLMNALVYAGLSKSSRWKSGRNR